MTHHLAICMFLYSLTCTNCLFKLDILFFFFFLAKPTAFGSSRARDQT